MKIDLDTIEFNKLTDEAYIKLAYLTLLERNIDETGYRFWLSKISNSTFCRKELITSILSSPEYYMHQKTPFHMMVHEGRQKWVKQMSEYKTILDIGGSSPNIKEGALIELGYKHRPKELYIFDKPVNEQYWGTPKYDQMQKYDFKWGTLTNFYGYAEEIHECEELTNLKFDCVFMGQVIEHLKPEKLNGILSWIKLHLKDDGHFIFDTPNRAITKIQSPNKLIDEDHKYEYTPLELKKILEKHGLAVINETGIVDMPDTYTTKTFNPLESYETSQINSNPQTSYLFAFDCMKK